MEYLSDIASLELNSIVSLTDDPWIKVERINFNIVEIQKNEEKGIERLLSVFVIDRLAFV